MAFVTDSDFQMLRLLDELRTEVSYGFGKGSQPSMFTLSS